MQSLDQLVEVEVLRVHRSAAGERKELRRKPRRSLRRAADLSQIRLVHVVGCESLDYELRVIENDREQVVEVMSDAADETTDALESLGLPEPVLGREPLFLRRAALGDIPDKGAEDLSSGRGHRSDRYLDRELTSIASARL